jgi:hypothetical protein
MPPESIPSVVYDKVPSVVYDKVTNWDKSTTLGCN